MGCVPCRQQALRVPAVRPWPVPVDVTVPMSVVVELEETVASFYQALAVWKPRIEAMRPGPARAAAVNRWQVWKREADALDQHVRHALSGRVG